MPPLLVVVSGPAGSGKTTLAHRLAAAIPCPAVCRDEVKEGLVHGTGGSDEDRQLHANSAFFEVVALLLDRGVSLVAEAAFQDRLWRNGLDPLLERAAIRVVQCHTDATTALRRRAGRGSRSAHDDGPLLDPAGADAYLRAFRRLDLDAPSIDVDTTDGYDPAVEQVVEFVTRRPV